ncbi:MAG: dihydropteroate synthase [Gammaproteobacteria bacterium]|nr:dihydropteroate synthase [Gammaproteobacteria bacterium]MBV8308349.1 dihydropteroate synthase [Gammaproteobacteria bacterium]MBV8405086.1 dihydropteroate synthase [Gammaproteobacteria bacterium]
MGVLNVTPDSFSDGARFDSPAAAIEQGLRMAAEGAAIIDVGGESTRPGAEPVSAQEELRRVLPVIEGLRRATSAVVISIDTSKPEVIRAAAGAGAGFINDVRALRAPGALEAAAATSCAVCLMHMQGEPRTMQVAPHYVDVVAEVRAFLAGRAAACRSAGIGPARLTVDPGFGFGKNLEHNLTLLRHLPELAADGYPVLVGLSRKSTVGKLTGRDGGERLPGSLALAVIAALKGARIIRAHDVAATVDALKVTAAVANGAGL